MKELSGDVRLSFGEKLYWLVYNACRICGNLVWVPSQYWGAAKVEKNASSPGRKYTDAFMLWALSTIPNITTASVLDIGGGSGYIRKTLDVVGFKGSYTCVDVEQDARFFNYTFTNFENKAIESGVETFNPSRTYDVVLTITSLEHIPDDVLAVKKAKEFTVSGGTQIHVVPAYWSLPLYLFHGYRQYTPYRIRKLFKDQPYTLYKLGGLFSTLTHFFCITIPERLLGTKGIRHHAWYSALAARAHALDRYVPFFAYMYAVVIK